MFSLQDKYAPTSICYGCGPANQQGLHIKSVVDDDQVIAHWHPQPHHNAFPNVLCGGIIGTILDCHSNWSAAWYLREEDEPEQLPCTVTAEYTIKLKKPTPMDKMLVLTAECVEKTNNKATVEAKLTCDDECFALCRGVFVAVKPGHPAFYRW